MLKIWRSPYSRFGINLEHPDDLQDETVLAEQNYTDDELKRIADSGFNAIWVHGQLHHLITNPRFPEFAPHADVHLKAMNTLCQRAATHGIRVLIYMQPPRAIPVSDHHFWNNHMDVAGEEYTRTGDDSKTFTSRCLCTSCESVRNYLREAFADLCLAIPELEGFIIISASEYPAHCYSGRNCRPGEIRPRTQKLDHVPCTCPRCSQREPEDVVVELLHTIRDGVRSVSPSKKLIFWNWSWTMYLDSPCTPILQQLPQDIYLLADFERGGYRKDGVYINEYSLGYSGPSEQYLDVTQVAQARSIPVMPKLQLGTTHELATVRSLPIFPSLFRKADYIRKHHCLGFMGCWNFGNLHSDSTKAFNFFLDLKTDLTEEQALLKFALKHYPNGNPETIVKAWKLFQLAMDDYPFTIPFLYNSPVNLVLGLIPHPGPLDGKKVGRSWLPDERGDSYEDSVTPLFPLEDIIRRFETISRTWNRGLELLQPELVDAPQEFGNAAICGAVWESTINMYRIYQMKLTWTDQSLPDYRELVQKELAIAEKVLPYLIADPEQGWHIEGNLYGFNETMVKAKIKALENYLAEH